MPGVGVLPYDVPQQVVSHTKIRQRALQVVRNDPAQAALDILGHCQRLDSRLLFVNQFVQIELCFNARPQDSGVNRLGDVIVCT